MIVHYCDKCKRVLYPEHIRLLTIDSKESAFSLDYELCEQCAEEIRESIVSIKKEK